MHQFLGKFEKNFSIPPLQTCWGSCSKSIIQPRL